MTSPSSSEGAPAAPAPARGRIAALDVIRGAALCGILFVNIAPLVHFGYDTGVLQPADLGDPSGWLQLFVQQRFFPIFSLLFGIGFALFFDSAARRSRRPRLVLLRRLLILLAIGIPFEFLQSGSALWPYAIAGLLVLLPSTWLPRWAVAVGAAVLIVASLALTGGGITLIPGVFLLGAALTRYGIVQSIGRSRGGSVVALLAFTAASIPLAIWQAGDIRMSGFDLASGLAGFAMAGAYIALLSLLMTTRAARGLQTVFTPLGKMALTNYVAAAPLMLAASALFDLPNSTSWTLLLSIVVGILVLQWIASTLWLRAFTQGPLEWLWRWGTWGTRGPLRRDSVRRGDMRDTERSAERADTAAWTSAPRP
ncbi:DUF418 domain-containing protein [Pseudoclavibacter sp. Z016]|uniref:DUF418 domain-containing protein n=1 Tax=Pseudoclavibacter sp. Z016 TaxID=2080581 RepID=UPI000CE83FE3|nr:DUF418 domain-containing protein [Pseudoclavibacter sp. Z016]PPF73325.1 hypothetical protein C5B99_15230 [Pseudoclavibacter sp. Z016]